MANDSASAALLKAASTGDAGAARRALDAGAAASRAALSGAAGGGHAEVARLLLQREADADAMESAAGDTALSVAAKGAHTAVILLLLEHGANAQRVGTAYGRDSPVPVALAALTGCAGAVRAFLEHPSNETSPSELVFWAGGREVLQLLADRGADMNTTVGGQGTPLYIAARNGAAARVRLLAEFGASPNVTHDRRTPLVASLVPCRATLASARERAVETALALLEVGANGGGEPKGTFLQLVSALRSGSPQVVRAMLDAGASPTRGQPLSFALVGKNGDRGIPQGPALLAIMRDLLDRGADPNAPDSCGRLPLASAVQLGNFKAAELLLERGANVNTGSLLPKAASSGDVEVVRLLLGAGLRHLDETCYLAAVRSDSVAVVRALLEAGVPVAPRDGSVHRAAVGKNAQVLVRLLVEHGAEFDYSCAGRPATYFAVEGGSVECLQMLLRWGVATEAGANEAPGGAPHGTLMDAAFWGCPWDRDRGAVAAELLANGLGRRTQSVDDWPSRTANAGALEAVRRWEAGEHPRQAERRGVEGALAPHLAAALLRLVGEYVHLVKMLEPPRRPDAVGSEPLAKRARGP